MKPLLVALALTVSLASPAHAARHTKVVFVGDSITAGTGLNPGESYPAVVQRLKPKIRATVYAVPGGTIADGGPWFVGVIDDALASHPDTIVVNLGTNDVNRGYPQGVIRDGFLRVNRKAKRQGVRVFYTTVGPRFGAELNPWLVSRFGGRVIDVGPAYQYIMGDGIHPNAAGADVMGRLVAGRLR